MPRDHLHRWEYVGIAVFGTLPITVKRCAKGCGRMRSIDVLGRDLTYDSFHGTATRHHVVSRSDASAR